MHEAATAIDDRLAQISSGLVSWYADAQRDLPWRNTSPWGVLVSEFMLQQTQVSRVLPRWHAFMQVWPTPPAMAAAPLHDVVRAWDRLGYPRRAKWLHENAVAITRDHAGEVPREVTALEALPGIGPYTARAIAVFAHGQREPVVDTNTRRVLARAVSGCAHALAPSSARDHALMLRLLPSDAATAAIVNAATMELGAVVCTARVPSCEACPLERLCAWRADGYPESAQPKPRAQAKFRGSAREARGELLAVLRSADGVVREAELLVRVSSPSLAELALASLLHDGLAVREGSGVRLA